MAELFADKKLDARIRAVLGRDPGDIGLTEDDHQKLRAANVFIPDARGPWNPRPAIDQPLRDILLQLALAQLLLEKARSALRGRGLRSWAGALSIVLDQFSPVLEKYQAMIKAGSHAKE